MQPIEIIIIAILILKAFGCIAAGWGIVLLVCFISAFIVGQHWEKK
jgi:hypothetical protein